MENNLVRSGDGSGRTINIVCPAIDILTGGRCRSVGSSVDAVIQSDRRNPILTVLSSSPDERTEIDRITTSKACLRPR